MSKVLEAAKSCYSNALRPAVNDLIAAYNDMQEANDPDIAAISAIEALVRISGAASDMATQIRAEVVASNVDSGVLKFDAGPYTATITRSPVSARVTDRAALQAAAPDLFEPQPDKVITTELTRRLKAGEDLPGAELATAGAPRLQIRAKS